MVWQPCLAKSPLHCNTSACTASPLLPALSRRWTSSSNRFFWDPSTSPKHSNVFYLRCFCKTALIFYLLLFCAGVFVYSCLCVCPFCVCVGLSVREIACLCVCMLAFCKPLYIRLCADMTSQACVVVILYHWHSRLSWPIFLSVIFFCLGPQPAAQRGHSLGGNSLLRRWPPGVLQHELQGSCRCNLGEWMDLGHGLPPEIKRHPMVLPGFYSFPGKGSGVLLVWKTQLQMSPWDCEMAGDWEAMFVCLPLWHIQFWLPKTATSHLCQPRCC